MYVMWLCRIYVTVYGLHFIFNFSLLPPPLPSPPVPSAPPLLSLLSSTDTSLHISATLAHLGLPAVTAVVLNVTSPVVLTQRIDISDSDTLPVTVTFTLTGLQLATAYHVLVYGVGEGGPGDITRGEFKTSEGLLML